MRCMSTSTCPYGQLVPSNVEELVLAHWDGCGVRAGGPMGQDGCLARAPSSEFWGRCELCRGGLGAHMSPLPCSPACPLPLGEPQKGKGCPGRTVCLSFPRLGCGAGCWACSLGTPPPPNHRLKLSFPSFVLPTGVSPSPTPAPPPAALAVPRVAWRGPAGLRPAHPVPPIATAAWRSSPPPPPASPASPPTTPASSPRTPRTPNRLPPCPRTSPARYGGGQRRRPTPSVPQFPLL